MAGSFGLKLPQILTMVRNKSAAGLAYSSLLIEIVSLTMGSGYNIHYGYPYSTFAETIIVLFQSHIIFFLAFLYGQVSLPKYAIGAGLTILEAYLFLADKMPEQVYVYNQMIIFVLGNFDINTSTLIQNSSDLHQLCKQVHRSSLSFIIPNGCWRMLR